MENFVQINFFFFPLSVSPINVRRRSGFKQVINKNQNDLLKMNFSVSLQALWL